MNCVRFCITNGNLVNITISGVVYGSYYRVVDVLFPLAG